MGDEEKKKKKGEAPTKGEDGKKKKKDGDKGKKDEEGGKKGEGKKDEEGGKKGEATLLQKKEDFDDVEEAVEKLLEQKGVDLSSSDRAKLGELMEKEKDGDEEKKKKKKGEAPTKGED